MMMNFTARSLANILFPNIFDRLTPITHKHIYKLDLHIIYAERKEKHLRGKEIEREREGSGLGYDLLDKDHDAVISGLALLFNILYFCFLF